MPQALVADVPPKLQNPRTKAFVTKLNDARQSDRLRSLDLVVFSLFYVGDHPSTLQMYKAQHYFFHDFVRTFADRLAEVSFLGATPMLNRAMVDFDINEADG
mmetsp:Transcript_33692/g.88563  ORF Transcript_33692/g.88563 Transcript_33692/m.88563 type:complete len:102 (-) Transcript_33692:1085-1390(-)